MKKPMAYIQSVSFYKQHVTNSHNILTLFSNTTLTCKTGPKCMPLYTPSLLASTSDENKNKLQRQNGGKITKNAPPSVPQVFPLALIPVARL